MFWVRILDYFKRDEIVGAGEGFHPDFEDPLLLWVPDEEFLHSEHIESRNSPPEVKRVV